MMMGEGGSGIFEEIGQKSKGMMGEGGSVMGEGGSG